MPVFIPVGLRQYLFPFPRDSHGICRVLVSSSHPRAALYYLSVSTQVHPSAHMFVFLFALLLNEANRQISLIKQKREMKIQKSPAKELRASQFTFLKTTLLSHHLTQIDQIWHSKTSRGWEGLQWTTQPQTMWDPRGNTLGFPVYVKKSKATLLSKKSSTSIVTQYQIVVPT